MAGQPGEMIDSDGVESSAPASSLEALNGFSISMFSDSPSPSMDDDKATTKIESESAFLGNGPRNMGLRELLSGPQGTERPGLREALSVGLVAHRRRFSQENQSWLKFLQLRTELLSDSTQNISLMPAPGILGNDFDNEEEALLKAGVFDDDEIVGLGDRSGNTNSVRPEDLLLLGYSKPESRTGRLSVRLAKGMDSTHSTATFHSLLPTDWSKPFGIDSAGTTGEVEIKEESSNHSKSFSFQNFMGKSISASTKTPDTWSINGDEVCQAAYSLGVSIDVARAPFHRTKVISIMPRFVVVNLIGRSLLVKQLGASGRRYVGGSGGDGTGVDALLSSEQSSVYPFTGQTLVVDGMQMASRDELSAFVSTSTVGSGLVDSQFTM